MSISELRTYLLVLANLSGIAFTALFAWLFEFSTVMLLVVLFGSLLLVNLVFLAKQRDG
ncbi:MAG: hypothetical protein ABIP81_03195 [Terriglobales bacterium]